MCELVVSSLDLGHGPGSLHCPGCSSTHRSLHRVDTGSFHYEMDPLQSLRPPLDRPTRRPVSSSLRFFSPFNGIFERAPCEEWVVQPHPVPLTGFLNLSAASASSSSTALFRAATVPGCPPFRAFPSTEIVYLFRGHWLPCDYSPTCWATRDRGLVTPGFPDAHTLRRSCLVPPAAMGSLFTGSHPLPGHPGPRT